MYVGDRNISPASSATGIRLAAGVIYVVTGPENDLLSQRYINASAATVVVNIEALGGAQ